MYVIYFDIVPIMSVIIGTISTSFESIYDSLMSSISLFAFDIDFEEWISTKDFILETLVKCIRSFMSR